MTPDLEARILPTAPGAACGWDQDRYRPLHCIEEEGKEYCSHAAECDYQVRIQGQHYCTYNRGD